MKKTLLITIISLIVVIIVFVCIILNALKTRDNENSINNQISFLEEEKNNEIISSKREEVKSATEYFTVQSCINKYITYVTEKDIDSILKILDSNYIEENNITEDNVLENIGNLSGMIIFEAEKMYVQQIDKNNSVYYVSGILKEDNIESVNGLTVVNNNFSIIVKLDFENMIFSIIPFEDGGIFNEED